MVSRIVDRRSKDDDPLPDEWIPVIRCEGNVIDLNGRIRREGMVADLMDPARMYNYWRAPWKRNSWRWRPRLRLSWPAGQLDGHPEWKDANQKPYSALVYERPFVGTTRWVETSFAAAATDATLFLYQRVRQACARRATRPYGRRWHAT